MYKLLDVHDNQGGVRKCIFMAKVEGQTGEVNTEGGPCIFPQKYLWLYHIYLTVLNNNESNKP